MDHGNDNSKLHWIFARGSLSTNTKNSSRYIELEKMTLKKKRNANIMVALRDLNGERMKLNSRLFDMKTRA